MEVSSPQKVWGGSGFRLQRCASVTPGSARVSLHEIGNPVFENIGLQAAAPSDLRTCSPHRGEPVRPVCGAIPRSRRWFFSDLKFFFFQSPFHLTDRLANVTGHRRAPAGQPRAGVRADGSSGLPVRLYGREGHARRGSEGTLPPRSSRAARSVARPRRPVCPSGPSTEPVAGSERPPGRPPRARGGPPANTMFLEPYDETPLSRVRSLPVRSLARRTPELRRGGPSSIGPPPLASAAAGGSVEHNPNSPEARVGRASPQPARFDLWATWLILPVAYACLKD